MRRDSGISSLRGISTASSAVLALVAGLWFTAQAQAQETTILHPGSMAVTGFSGTVIPRIEEGLPQGVDPVDETFIDTGRATLRVFDASALGGPPGGQLVYTPPPFEVLASQIGQVFALAYDDGVHGDGLTGVPNLYAGATSLHGLRIVTPDEDADGRPERQRRGKAGASFMDGQFAESNGGSPGAIWKVDGVSGAVSLFATIDGNSGPGIGDVSFDAPSRQLFASDLDTGLIHRIGADGALIDTFDHGVAGRPAHSLAPIADDGAVTEIQSAEFDSEDPGSWGFTQDERRVWAVMAHGGRIYYSVGNAAEIWSVGINHQGGFGNDVRRELTVAADQDYPVADIAFDSHGFMYLAQRGDVQNRYDYGQDADSGNGQVQRYWRESPDDPATESIWVAAPQEHAAGFPAGHGQAAGGLDLQYGYDDQGNVNLNACGDSLVKTGDKLRESDDPAIQEQLATGGALSVHGVEITATSPARAANAPPFGSWFVDFDGYFDAPETGGPGTQGNVGDVEIWHPCEGRAGYNEQVPAGHLPPEFPPVEKKIDLTIVKHAAHASCSLDGVCDWAVFIVNSGTETFNAPLTVAVNHPTGAPAASTFEPSPPWSCGLAGPGEYRCDIAGIVLVPGASARIGVRTTIPSDHAADSVTSCAKIQPVPDEGDLSNNEACADQRVPREHPGQPALGITKTCAAAAAGAAVSCRITVISLGTAAPSGPVRINDAAAILGAATPVQIQTVIPDGPQWYCGPVPADTLSCRIPGAELMPGTSRHFDVTLTVPANDRFESCALGSFGPAPGDDIVHPIGKACDQGGADIDVETTGDARCLAGQPCTFEIAIRNAGDSALSGRVRIGDAMEALGAGSLDGVAISEVTPAFGCDSEPTTLPFDCEATLNLAAGESRVHQVTVVIPADGSLDNTGDGVDAQNCVAVIAPEAIPTRGGAQPPAATPGKRDGGASACHPFTIVKKPAEQCSEGFAMNAEGRCVCPEGTAFRNGQCSPALDKPKQCILLPGMIRTDSGKCICPKGTELKSGACSTVEQPPVRQCKLLPGMIRTQSGKCICPKRTELKNGACRTVEQPPVRQCKLLRGQVRTENGRCICPRGTRLAGGQCRKTTIECRRGTRLKNGTCVPVAVVDPKGCPVGMVGKYPNCRKPPRVRPGLTIKPNRVDPGLILRRSARPANPVVTRPNRVTNPVVTRPNRVTNPVVTRPNRVTGPAVTRPTRPTGPVVRQRVIRNTNRTTRN